MVEEQVILVAEEFGEPDRLVIGDAERVVLVEPRRHWHFAALRRDALDVTFEGSRLLADPARPLLPRAHAGA
jgi:hypothetical protein